MNRVARSAALVAIAVIGAACAATPAVEVEEANASSGPLRPDGQASFPDTDTDTGTAGSPAPATSLDWASCDEYGIPSWATASTSGWECARLAVEMDGYASTDGLAPVELALTRHRATGDRQGAIVVNPGGPGAAGLPTAWGVRPSMPTELLRGFDIVSWDPRGIGQSTPRITCDGADSFADDFIERCVEATGELSAYLSAPYSAADMEAVRLALGEDRLNYLGYSYGSLLGATYAERFPESVGAFVLDGVTSPLAGSSEGPFEDGFAMFADDGRPAALDRLLELCDATDRCLPGRSAPAVLDDVSARVDALTTDDFAGEPATVDEEDFRVFVDTSLTYAGDWELLATALDDADGGDGSALAALIADDAALLDGDDDSPEDAGPEDDGALPDNFSDANYMIYCADFGPLITRWSFCDAMPANVEALGPVTPVDIDRPMLVIGTEYDPLTPGKHAPEFAAALGEASHMIWDGVGHTAFPGWTDCIDDAVTAQFVGEAVPPDGTRCTMVEGITDDVELADGLFGFDRAEAVSWLEDAIEFHGRVDGEVSCLANGVLGAVEPGDDRVDDRLVSHVVLDVTSDVAEVTLAAAEARC
jgi:pimeloyl-ACP methyl ester carboxylesterase